MENREVLKNIGSKIRAARLKANYSQAQLADLIPMKRYSLTKIELGRANSYILTLQRIANVLRVDIKDFL